MQVKNYSCNLNKVKRNNNPLLPQSIRGLIIGQSGSGKTTALLNLILRPGWLDYDHLFIFGRSMKQQPQYQLLKQAMDEGLKKDTINNIFSNMSNIENLGLTFEDVIKEAKDQEKESKKKGGGVIVPCFDEEEDEVIDPRELNTENKNLMIFDDLLKEKQTTPEKYFIRGRHGNCDCFYLSQSFFSLPRHTIRGNCNFLMLFELPERDITNIYNDYVLKDMSLNEFKSFLYDCWSVPFNFAVIDKTSHRDNGRYRSGFDRFYFPYY